MKKRNVVVANWKMNPQTSLEAKEIFQKIKRQAEKLKRTQVLVAPSTVHLSMLAKIARGKNVALCSQNIHHKDDGAYTGETSIASVRDLKIKYVLIGHSERRVMGESNADVRLKMESALTRGMTPIVCIGESERDREGAYLELLRAQLLEIFGGLHKKNIQDCMIAYEPIWAIGKSYRESMTATDMHETSLFLRKTMSDLFGKDYGWNVTILYGGSVEPDNAESLIERGDIQGFLVGHESLVPEDFSKILKIVDTHK